MQDVTAPLARLVKRWTGFENLEQLVEAEEPLALDCKVGASKNRWERFQREFLCDCYDNLCVLRGKRRQWDASFRVAHRWGAPPHRAGKALDAVLAVANDEAFLENVTSWTLRATAYRRAWLYYASRPVVGSVRLADLAARV